MALLLLGYCKASTFVLVSQKSPGAHGVYLKQPKTLKNHKEELEQNSLL